MWPCILRSVVLHKFHHSKAALTEKGFALTDVLSKRNFHRSSHRWTVTEMAQLDSQQLSLLNEPCIVVDNHDCPVRMETKKACHLLTKGSAKGILHRAFSVFLFDLDGKLLLQQRSMAKITFPGYYTNSCCSHPLYTPSEMEYDNAVGVKRAAQRRLEIELGIPKEQIPLEQIHYITRIHYFFPSDDQWGEHEMDYILVVKANVTINSNPNEVMNYCSIAQKEFPKFLANLEEQNIPITPWFRFVANNFLMDWWTNLSNIQSIQDHDVIHRV